MTRTGCHFQVRPTADMAKPFSMTCVARASSDGSIATRNDLTRRSATGRQPLPRSVKPNLSNWKRR